MQMQIKQIKGVCQDKQLLDHELSNWIKDNNNNNNSSNKTKPSVLNLSASKSNSKQKRQECMLAANVAPTLAPKKPQSTANKTGLAN